MFLLKRTQESEEMSEPLKRRRKGPQAKGYRQPLEAEKMEGNGFSPQSLLKEPVLYLTFAGGNDIRLLNYKTI